MRISKQQGAAGQLRELRRGITFSGFLILLINVFFLIVRECIPNIGRRRDEGADVGKLRNPVGAVLPLCG
jgi:hypothetical protein